MITNTYLRYLVRNPEEISNLTEREIRVLARLVKKTFRKEEFLIDLYERENSEILVFGDIHGDLNSLLILLGEINERQPKRIIFLGDFVDRGPKQFECLISLFALKILEPSRFIILRGNHENLEMNKEFGLYNVVKTGFQCEYKEILDVFNFLPLIVRINNTILCVHGGIPREVKILQQLKGLKTVEPINSKSRNLASSFLEIMWNDPKERLTDRFSDSYRGNGIYYYGSEVFDEFMKQNKLQYLIRSHEIFPEGYKWFFNKRLLSIFSSAYYNSLYHPNLASYAVILNNKVKPLIF